MEGRDFSELVESGLIGQVEEIVVDGHRRLHESSGRAWSRPAAYRWLRYEDPAPVRRLADGVRKLRSRGVRFDGEAVDKACVTASRKGFSN
ncbi:MAG TPA: hypothetical protein VNF26_08680 [Candidatus Baltobacterales bacterium]|nr:hypothetical protein [Candidatus Baltobacterales bacterium]